MMETDVDGISNSLLTLTSMSDYERGAIGTNGRRLVEMSFQRSHIARQMADVNDWVLGGSRPGTVEIWN